MIKNNLFIKFLLFLLYGLFSGSGLIVIKISLKNKINDISSLTSLLFNIDFLSGFVMYAIGFFLWIIILSMYNLNQAFPIAMSIFFTITTLASYYILKEPISFLHIFGISLCFTGIILINIT